MTLSEPSAHCPGASSFDILLPTLHHTKLVTPWALPPSALQLFEAGVRPGGPVDHELRMPTGRLGLTVLSLALSPPQAGCAAIRGALRLFATASGGAPSAARSMNARRLGARKSGRGSPRASDAGAERPAPREYRGVTDRSKPKRKVCLHVGFLGSNYHGMQFQSGKREVRTVEGELISALTRWGGISAENAEQPTKVGWQRASRTDKGVHAIGATVSCKLLLSDEQLEEVPISSAGLGGFCDGLEAEASGEAAGAQEASSVTAVTAAQLAELNAYLPEDIKVFSIQRTRGGFNA